MVATLFERYNKTISRSAVMDGCAQSCRHGIFTGRTDPRAGDHQLIYISIQKCIHRYTYSIHIPTRKSSMTEGGCNFEHIGCPWKRFWGCPATTYLWRYTQVVRKKCKRSRFSPNIFRERPPGSLVGWNASLPFPFRGPWVCSMNSDILKPKRSMLAYTNFEVSCRWKETRLFQPEVTEEEERVETGKDSPARFFGVLTDFFQRWIHFSYLRIVFCVFCIYALKFA